MSFLEYVPPPSIQTSTEYNMAICSICRHQWQLCYDIKTNPYPQNENVMLNGCLMCKGISPNATADEKS